MPTERRQAFIAEEAKFSTQRFVTYVLLLIFAAVTAYVFYGNDQAERSTVLQTVINFTMLAIGFWLGSSKGAADNREQLNKMIPVAPAAAAVASTAAAIEATAINTEQIVENTKDGLKKT